MTTKIINRIAAATLLFISAIPVAAIASSASVTLSNINITSTLTDTQSWIHWWDKIFVYGEPNPPRTSFGVQYDYVVADLHPPISLGNSRIDKWSDEYYSLSDSGSIPGVTAYGLMTMTHGTYNIFTYLWTCRMSWRCIAIGSMRQSGHFLRSILGARDRGANSI